MGSTGGLLAGDKPGELDNRDGPFEGELQLRSKRPGIHYRLVGDQMSTELIQVGAVGATQLLDSLGYRLALLD